MILTIISGSILGIRYYNANCLSDFVQFGFDNFVKTYM